jgi:phosphate/sulfate permease
MWCIRRLAVAVLVVGVAPIFVLFLGLFLAELLGCPISTSGTGSCSVFGTDMAGLLTALTLFSVPMFVMLTPPAAIVLVLWLLAELYNGFIDHIP